MIDAIFKISKTLYMLDQNIENQIKKSNKEAHKAYIKLIDLRFFMLVNKLIEIINHMLKSKN